MPVGFNFTMDSPLVTFDLKEKYLLVNGHGKRDNLASMVEASAQIYAKVMETDSRYLLVDYRNLQISVHLCEAFNIVKRYEAVQPQLKKVIVAAVFHGNSIEFGAYWRDISQQRGFKFEIFEDMHAAEKWLLEQSELM